MRNLNSALRRLNDHHIIILVGASLVVHGLLLLNDGVYYDGWGRYIHLVDKDWTNFNLWATESGGPPITIYLHWVMGYLPSFVFCYKLVSFLSITFSAILVYLICNELRVLSRTERLFIALLSLSYPAFQLSVDLIMMPYLLRYCLFLLACFMALRLDKTNGFRQYFLRVGSLALFVLSFATESFLVFYFGFLLVLILHARRERNIPPKHVFTRFLPHRMDYVLLPILYWVVDRVFFPSHGFYATYNAISFAPSRIVSVYNASINNAVYAQIKGSLEILLDHRLLALLVVFAVIALLWIRSTFRGGSIRSADKKWDSYAVLLFGIVLLVLAIFPYAAVGSEARVHGYGTRHALLVGLPMAIILVSATRLLFSRNTRYISQCSLFLLMILLLAFTLSSVTNYMSWQARWVKDRSVMVNLAELEGAEGISVFWVHDEYQGEYNYGGQPIYLSYEWTRMFKVVWGDESRIGMEDVHQSRLFLYYLAWGERSKYKERLSLSDFDPKGCQAELTIRPGPNALGDAELSRLNPYYNPARLSAIYLYHKLFSSEDRLTEFLHGVTSLELQPRSAPFAVNCPSR